MNPKSRIFALIFSSVLLLSVVFSVWLFAPKVESAKEEKTENEIVNYDIRTDKTVDARKTFEDFIRQANKTPEAIELDKKSSIEAEKRLREKIGSLKIEKSETLDIPEIISPETGLKSSFLTPPANAEKSATLRSFLRENSALFGLSDAQISALKTSANYTNPDGNLSYVHFEQRINDIPVFQGEVKAGLTKRGEIIRVINNLAPNLFSENVSDNFGNPQAAVINAAKHIGIAANENDLKIINSNNQKITFEHGQFADRTTAEKIYFPLASGVARPAWRVILWTSAAAFYLVIDADTGTLLWRKNITEHQTQPATYNVYGNTTSMTKTGDNPIPFTPGCVNPINCQIPPIVNRQSFTLIGNEPPYNFNNNGWINDGENRTIGNNAEAGIDRMPPNGIDDNGWAFGDPNRNFVYTYNPFPGNPPPGEEPLPQTQTYPPSQFQQGSITNAFYTINRWHDETYLLGFTEAARNYQTDNFGRGGAGNDSIVVEIQDGSGTNGGNFTTLPDGERPRLQLFIWTGTTPSKDGALDNQVAVHEATHGLSNRLHGNASGLNSNMARGMGEGWSDFYALALLSDPTDDLFGTYSIACYSITGISGANCYYGIRRYPTSIIRSLGANNNPHNAYRFSDINAGCAARLTTANFAFERGIFGVTQCDQIHNAGEIWNVALWEVRAFLIEQHGAVEGNRRALQYVTDGMKLSPINPTMLQSRDAILFAATASNPADVMEVWRGFAVRGMGFSASIQSISPAVVTDGFDLPNAIMTNPFSVSDAPGNGNGFPEPGENVLLSVAVTNNTGSTVNNVTATVTGGGSENYGNIAHGDTVVREIPYTIPGDAVCGSFHEVTITVASALGANTPQTREFRLGAPVGGAPVSFTNSTPIDIPAGQPTTTSGPASPYPSVINVSGLSGTKIMKVRFNGFRHEFPDDVDMLLVGPGGQKYIFLSDVGGSTEQLTPITFTVADTGATLLPDNAPFVDGTEYRPSNVGANDPFDAPAPAPPYENAAPAGSATFASVFGTNGANFNGNWSLYIDDDAGSDPGRIEGGWTLIFESDEYECSLAPSGTARADFDGDGRTDLSVFRPSEGNWYINGSTSGFSVINWGLSGDVLAPGDFDGDGKTDIAIFRPDSDSNLPDFYILNSSNFTFSGLSWGLPGDIPVIEDYDGDGKADIAVFRPSDSTFYVLQSSNGNVLTYSGAAPGFLPVAGDFDGDGKGDFAVFSNGEWRISRSTDNHQTGEIIFWGLDGDKLVPADFDGDGIDDLAVYRPGEGVWYIRRSSGGNTIVQFGLADDIPVPGDYDGDGKDDIAVYRDGIWYVIQSTSGVLISQFGLSNDLPIPNQYLP